MSRQPGERGAEDGACENDGPQDVNPHEKDGNGGKGAIDEIIGGETGDEGGESALYQQEGEGGEKGLSLIHISEPTRLLSISYAVFCLNTARELSLIHI